MNQILHRLLMAALGTAAIFTINTLNALTEASPAAEFEGTKLHQDRVFFRCNNGQYRAWKIPRTTLFKHSKGFVGMTLFLSPAG